MTRNGNIKPNWCNYEALLAGFYEVRKNKCYHKGILEFENNLVSNLNRILESLEDGTYAVKPTRDFYVYDPKKRLIQAPHLEDRIVQYAVMASVNGIIQKRFLTNTAACIKGRGTHYAHKLLKRYLSNFGNNGYCLKIDIKKFFYNIDHNVLRNLLKRVIKCNDTLKILNKFYANEKGVGLPLGSLSSQVLANLMLNPVDQLCKRELKCKYYIRYMDDIIILSNSRDRLKSILRAITELLGKLKLELNAKTCISTIKSGVDFVGYRTWINRTIIRKRSLFKIKRTLKKHNERNRIFSFLAHSKGTSSILYVVNLILSVCPKILYELRVWALKNNEWRVINEIC